MVNQNTHETMNNGRKFSSSLRKLWQDITQPHSSITDKDLQRRARLISGLGLGLFIALLIGTIAAFYRDSNIQAHLLATILMCGVYLLSRTRHTSIAGILMLLIAAIPSLNFFIELGTGLDNVPVYEGAIWLAIPIVTGGLILPIRGSLIVDSIILAC